MPKRKAKGAGGKPARRQPARTDAEVEQLLEDLERAILGEDRARVHAITEQLWESRARVPDLLAARLIDGRAQIPAFAFEMLGGFAGARAGTHLRRIADDERAPDIVRFGARRRAGWPERGEAKRRVAFLDSLRDPEGTLVLALDQATDGWPPSADILQEVLGYLVALASRRRRTTVERMVAELGERTGWLLRALLHVEDPATQRLALAELARFREVGAGGAIGRLAKTAADAEIRAEAAAVLQRLQVQVVGSGGAEPAPLPPVRRAYMSMIDGDGGQMILVERQLADGVLLLADVFHNDSWGIKGAFGATRATPEDLEDIVTELEEQGIELVEVDLAAVRGSLALAVEANAATGHAIPPVFELWELLVHDAYPPPPDEPITIPEADDAPYRGRADLVRSSGRLLEHPFFETWGFDPARTSAATLGTRPPSSGRLTDRQYGPMIEALFDLPTREQFRRRLRRQAWLLEQVGETRAAQQALAVSAQLADATPSELARQPFLRSLVDRSVLELAAGTVLPQLASYLASQDPEAFEDLWR